MLLELLRELLLRGPHSVEALSHEWRDEALHVIRHGARADVINEKVILIRKATDHEWFASSL
jgi:hypothetical protein